MKKIWESCFHGLTRQEKSKEKVMKEKRDGPRAIPWVVVDNETL